MHCVGAFCIAQLLPEPGGRLVNCRVNRIVGVRLREVVVSPDDKAYFVLPGRHLPHFEARRTPEFSAGLPLTKEGVQSLIITTRISTATLAAARHLPVANQMGGPILVGRRNGRDGCGPHDGGSLGTQRVRVQITFSIQAARKCPIVSETRNPYLQLVARGVERATMNRDGCGPKQDLLCSRPIWEPLLNSSTRLPRLVNTASNLPPPPGSRPPNTPRTDSFRQENPHP